MDEYIKREEAIKIAESYRPQNGSSFCRNRGIADYIAEDISMIPSADVFPVRHGRWKPYHEADIGYDEYGVRCSNCGFEVEDHEVKFVMNYCTRCGAKMDGGFDNG